MSLRIDQDHSRFRAIVRGKIRQNLRKYISQGELIGRKGKDLVSIPIPQIDIPALNPNFTGNVGFGPISVPSVRIPGINPINIVMHTDQVLGELGYDKEAIAVRYRQ